jgi:ferredoxin
MPTKLSNTNTKYKTKALPASNLNQGRRVYRNKKLLEVVRQSPCQHCGRQDGTVVAAHSNLLKDGKGRGIKASDYRIAALCFTCHSELDQGNKMSREERKELWENAHRATVGWLFEDGHLTVS